jgi:hypothetical protein
VIRGVARINISLCRILLGIKLPFYYHPVKGTRSIGSVLRCLDVFVFEFLGCQTVISGYYYMAG